ncbi:response regulator transcription factor [Komagataeibacter swingsii]|uniref:DNA-binding response regulator n=1 Tax=Komagataeibacter swingsii TaxID=215220 RepID=A0A2V4R2G9_9PROT|nr:response regulator transcription factor [Komagataeibacter swingsii]PYD68933.1 DNA-binding response regulator [Komagataeibacter swingsii]GBQ63925.1 two component response regulator [Komagataeibacter swingsii DSM 16373]
MTLVARPRLLLVEDDRATTEYLRQGLEESGIDVVSVANGNDGSQYALSQPWDVIILDRMLPGLDGLTVLMRLRAHAITTPVLFLTTMDGVPSRVAGLRHGADDYMIKPFALRELVARVQVLLRRSSSFQHATVMNVADVELNLLTLAVTRNGEKILLQPQELKLLEYFMRNAGTVLSRKMLLKDVWHMDFPVRTNLVETHVCRLREKLGQDGQSLIRTVRGSGYVMGA